VPYPVFLTDSAVCDLEELDAYITRYDSAERADYVLGNIEEAIESLSEQADRGVYPQELSSLGIREYREIFFKPYRLIYRVMNDAVYIYLIVDGRRDMQTLLERRLLRESWISGTDSRLVNTDAGSLPWQNGSNNVKFFSEAGVPYDVSLLMPKWGD